MSISQIDGQTNISRVYINIHSFEKVIYLIQLPIQCVQLTSLSLQQNVVAQH